LLVERSKEVMLGQLVPCGGGDVIPLQAKKLLVGRRSHCDIKLDFPNVSSHHCELELKDGYWFVRDLGSANGLKVNGERCSDSVLMPGDELSIAKHAFRVEYEVHAGAEVPESENPFARSLMEKAGLEVRRPKQDDSGDAGKPAPKKQTRRVSSEDDFIMDWLND
jgi:adenylate cyclase